jgi:hypothetical protein
MRVRTWNPAAAFTATLLAAAFLMPSCADDSITDDDQSLITRIDVYAGDDQTGTVGSLIPDPLVVRASDILGNPRPGIAVQFSTSNAGASVSPASAQTGASGLASCVFRLGSSTGEQRVGVSIEGDSTYFTATATALECPEEDPEGACGWPSGHIFITTTSSSLLSGNGSVVIDYDPGTGAIEKVLETTELIIDLAFSPRGELFLSTTDEIFKVDPENKSLSVFHTYASPAPVEIEPNYGSVLTAVTATKLFGIFCPASVLSAETGVVAGRAECLAVDPVSRDAWIVTGVNPTFRFHRYPWDGRSDFGPGVEEVIAATGTSSPAGMCADSTGNIYVVLDGSGADRTIGRIAADGTWQKDFFDLYDYSATGRWGDIAYLDGELYLIDTQNNALAAISATGPGFIINVLTNTAFSAQNDHGERYGIAASPVFNCP